MVADTSGNIYYQRAGRVPVRAEGFDWSRPVDGSTSETDWDLFHPSSSLLQIKNPPQGYMQNTNIPPDAMMVNGPFKFDDYLPEIYSSAHYGERHGWINQRGARALELLSEDDSVTIEEARDYALDVKSYGIERWLNALVMSVGDSEEGRLQTAIEEIRDWNGEPRRTSAPHSSTRTFGFALAEVMTQANHEELRAGSTNGTGSSRPTCRTR
ncbi:MAG: penicillin acylase family protein [Gammaproteobacteria bacterium]|nr:penicillin acylase family protein [Gammaproteobacteria bacterium]